MLLSRHDCKCGTNSGLQKTMVRSCQGSILVVEDEANDRFLIEMALRENGVTSPIWLVNDPWQLRTIVF